MTKTVLVVDDCPATRAVIRSMLEPLGYRVLEAGDGVEAIRCLQSGTRVHTVLLDVDMPDLHGIEVLTRLRALHLPVQPRVVMCTAYRDSVEIQRALDAGADEYVMKPFDAGILSGKLAEVGLA